MKDWLEKIDESKEEESKKTPQKKYNVFFPSRKAVVPFQSYITPIKFEDYDLVTKFA